MLKDAPMGELYEFVPCGVYVRGAGSMPMIAPPLKGSPSESPALLSGHPGQGVKGDRPAELDGENEEARDRIEWWNDHPTTLGAQADKR